MLLLLFLIMVNKTSQGRISNVVYVDATKGTLNAECGRARYSACKHLRAAITNMGTKKIIVHLIGEHIVSDEIPLLSDICITTSEKDRGMIVADKKKKNLYAFVVRKGGIHVEVSNIMFRSISVLMSHLGVKVSITNVHVTGTSLFFRQRKVAVFLAFKYSRPSEIMKRKNEGSFELYISRSTFTNTNQVVIIEWAKKVRKIVSVQDSIFSKTGGLDVMQGTLTMHNCTFEKTYGKAIHAHKGAESVQITLSLFTDGGNETRLSDFVATWNVKKVFISRCSFYNNFDKCVTIRGAQTAVVQHNSFTQCRAYGSGGAISIGNPLEKFTIQKCVFRDNTAKKMGGAVFLANRRVGLVNPTHVTISTCLFINNKATIDGQAISSNLKIHLQNVWIFAGQTRRTSHLHLVGELIKIGEINLVTKYDGSIQNSIVLPGILVISNDLQVTGQINYTCPRHFNMVSYNTWNTGLRIQETSGKPRPDQFFTYFVARCESCPSNQYTLTTGMLNVHPFRQISGNINWNTRWRQYKTTNVCLPCPIGARCNGNIVPLDNYWGYHTSHSELSFTRCPNGHCCSSQGTPCADYNSCEKGRTGILCGSCDVGYSQNVVTNSCIERKSGERNPGMFAVYFVIASLFFTIVFTFSPFLFQIIMRKYASLRGQTSTNDVRTSVNERQFDDTLQNSEKDEEASPKYDEPRDEISSNIQKDEDEEISLPFSAYVVNVVLFFQVVSLVHVPVPGESRSNIVGFQSTLFNLFNFRFTIYRHLHPMDNLTLPMKELLNVFLKLSSIFNLILLFIAWKCIKVMRSIFFANDSFNAANETMELQVKQSSEGSHDIQTLSFPSILKIGFLRLVKLNLTSIFAFTFHMIHCVKIENHLHLYLYGDHECYSNWQYVIMFVVFPIVLLSPASFGISVNLLREGMISTNTFLVAFTFPYYTIWLYAKQKLVGLRDRIPLDDEKLCIRAILEMEDDLFKPNKAWLRWPTVQLYRNFLVVILNSLILNPIYRSVSFMTLFVLFLRHDCTRMPYKHEFMNQLQSLSSTCLSIISACNIPASIIVMTNAMLFPYMRHVIMALQYLEITISAVVPLFLVVWKLWARYVTAARLRNTIK